MKGMAMRVNYSYLHQQFADVEEYFTDLRHLVSTGEFTLGPFVERFERKFADYIGVNHVISTNTGTDALILALKAVGVKPDDDVITVPNTFIATVGAIVAAGARPVFVDCDPRTRNIDLERIEGLQPRLQDARALLADGKVQQTASIANAAADPGCFGSRAFFIRPGTKRHPRPIGQRHTRSLAAFL